VQRFTLEWRAQIARDFQEGRISVTPAAKQAPVMPALAVASHEAPAPGTRAARSTPIDTGVHI